MFENSTHNICRSSNLTSCEKATQKEKQNPLEFKSLTIICVFGPFIQIFLEFSNTEFNQTQKYRSGQSDRKGIIE